jgi:tetratricopeptide (TPR) repeat protein
MSLPPIVLAAALANAASTMAGPASPVSRSAQRKHLNVRATDVFAIAEKARQRGDLETAERAYKALAEDSDSDIRAEAMFRHGKMLLETGRLTGAALLFRQVADQHPKAAAARLQLAKTLELLGYKDAAWREVRAVQASGLPPEVARMVDRYSEALRASRPFGASLQVSLAPDSNINRSTKSDTLGTVLGDFEIDESSKAKSGMGLSLSGQAYRRLPLGKNDFAILARVSGIADLYRHSDFNDVALDFAVGPELQLGRSRLNVEAAATQRWYGMDPYMRSVRVSASLIRPLGRMTQVQLAGTAGIANYRTNDLQDAKSFYGRLKLERALSATTGIALNLSAGRIAAEDPAYSSKEWRIGLIGWRDVGRATLTAEAEYGRLRADDRLALLPDRRSDRYSRLTVGATFRQLTFAGFAPVARIIIERNKSTIEFYDYSRKRTEFGIIRAF